jgi:hypothetical protein
LSSDRAQHIAVERTSVIQPIRSTGVGEIDDGITLKRRSSSGTSPRTTTIRTTTTRTAAMRTATTNRLLTVAPGHLDLDLVR